jgi:hypothetical protein
MFWLLLGGLKGAAIPAMSVLATGNSVSKAISSADRQVRKRLPAEMFDDTEYFMRHMLYTPFQMAQLGLWSPSWHVAWSHEEVGRYVFLEEHSLNGGPDSSTMKRELKALLISGADRYRKMSQMSEAAGTSL